MKVSTRYTIVSLAGTSDLSMDDEASHATRLPEPLKAFLTQNERVKDVRNERLPNVVQMRAKSKSALHLTKHYKGCIRRFRRT